MLRPENRKYAAHPMKCMAQDSLLEALDHYEKKGFEGQFSTRAGGMIHCHACNADEPAAQVPVEGMHRFEGPSDPSEEAVLVALECPSCGAWGTASLSYGPESSREDAGALVELLDARDIGPIVPGQ